MPQTEVYNLVLFGIIGGLFVCLIGLSFYFDHREHVRTLSPEVKYVISPQVKYEMLEFSDDEEKAMVALKMFLRCGTAFTEENAGLIIRLIDRVRDRHFVNPRH
jgi:hypothetical protein